MAENKNIAYKRSLTSATIFLILILSFFSVQGGTTTTSDTIFLGDFSGTYSIYHEGFGNSNQTVITDTDWVLDEITVTGSTGTVSVLDQFIAADSSETEINRNALFIGPGSINSNSIYNGSNGPEGQDSQTGIIVTGENYGVLLETGSLVFNDSFGGIVDSVASASGNYQIEQYGGFGTFNPTSFIPSDIFISIMLAGTDTGTLRGVNFGSIPQPGHDLFTSNTTGWGGGEAEMFFSAGDNELETLMSFATAHGEISISALFDFLEAYIYYEGRDYNQMSKE